MGEVSTHSASLKLTEKSSSNIIRCAWYARYQAL